MRIATWNVNSVRQRIESLMSWLKECSPDVVCLQEIKCTDDAFPRLEIESLGYNVVTHGQKIGHQPQHRLPGAWVRLFQESEQLANSRTQSFLASFELFEDLDAAGQTATFCLESGDRPLRFILLAANAFLFLAVVGQPLPGPDLVRMFRQALHQPLEVLSQLDGRGIDRPRMVGHGGTSSGTE